MTQKSKTQDSKTYLTMNYSNWAMNKTPFYRYWVATTTIPCKYERT